MLMQHDSKIMEGVAARIAAAQAARDARVRLLAILAHRTRDLSLAEDALSDAFALAIEHWSRDGVPTNPEAWLLTAARRRLIDAQRASSAATRAAAALASDTMRDGAQARANLIEAMDMDGAHIPDERLGLLFLCAHPHIDEAMRTPLMLQSVLGLPAARIASLFLVSPGTMAQRLVRVKESIRGQPPRFDPPTPAEVPERLGAVLRAVYAAFTAGLDHAAEDAHHRGGIGTLGDDAIWLGRMLAEMLPDEPEVLGLLALMLFSESRRDARRVGGVYVPLSEQDTGLWNRGLIDEAEQLLLRAAGMRRHGRLQLEAAIQSAHAARLRSGRTDWAAIVGLYEGLIAIAPSIGAGVAHAAAVREVRGDLEAMRLLDTLHSQAGPRVRGYQPYWATRAVVCDELGRAAEATEAWTIAIGLTDDAATRAWLVEQRDRK